MLCSAERELQHRVGGVQPPQPRPRLLLLVLQQGRPGRPRHPPQHRADPHQPQHARVPGQPPLQSGPRCYANTSFCRATSPTPTMTWSATLWSPSHTGSGVSRYNKYLLCYFNPPILTLLVTCYANSKYTNYLTRYLVYMFTSVCGEC